MKQLCFILFVVATFQLSSCESLTQPSGRNNKQIKPVQLYVRDFGATPQTVNIYMALQRVLAAAKKLNCPVEILFEPNAVYRITLANAAELKETDSGFADQYSWHIKDATNMVINGQGATLVFTDPEVGGICMENSYHIELKNFKFNYDPLPYTQGTIARVNQEEYWFELKLGDGYPEPNTPNFERAEKTYGNWGLTIHDEANGRHRYGPTAIFSDHWEKTGNRLWRFFPAKQGSNYSLQDDPLLASGLKIGNRYVHMARTWSQAIATKNCDYVLWENLTVYASPGLAFYPRGTSHHIIRDCHTKLKGDRIFSTNADGIHMRGSRGHMLVEDCSFNGMADDGINVHSSALSVVAVPAANQLVVNKHTFSVRAGDELIQVRPISAKIIGKATVKSVQDQGSTWLITLNEILEDVSCGSDSEPSDYFYNLSESATPFVINNCHFKNFRGRGILVSAYGGVIENNIFEMPEGWAIVLHYESARWSDGPLACDLIIRNNEFNGHGSSENSAIRTKITTRGGSGVNGRPFRNILIEDNSFYDYGMPVMDIHHACNVTIRDNRSICDSEAIRRKSEYAAVELYDCENVIVNGFAVEDRDARQIAAVKIDTDCGESIEIENLELDVSKTCKPVMDLRKE